MTPTINEIIFKITYDEYRKYYQEVCDNHQSVYKAFGKDWYIVCLEADGISGHFATFRLAS